MIIIKNNNSMFRATVGCSGRKAVTYGDADQQVERLIDPACGECSNKTKSITVSRVVPTALNNCIAEFYHESP